MSNKSLSFYVYIAIGLIVVLAAIAFWAVFTLKPAQAPGAPIAEEPRLTKQEALTILIPELGMDCLEQGVPESYKTCNVRVFKEVDGPGWKVWVTYEGLYDDSVRASRLEAYIINRGGKWVVGDIYISSQCQEGRGHQDFSSELCA